MKLKSSYFYTLRENAKDEESVSGNLLTRSGMIKKTSSGVYMYLPLGYKVMKNIEKIIREEMENVNAGELLMPALINEEVYRTLREAFSRWEISRTIRDTLEEKLHNYLLDKAQEFANKVLNKEIN